MLQKEAVVPEMYSLIKDLNDGLYVASSGLAKAFEKAIKLIKEGVPPDLSPNS